MWLPLKREQETNMIDPYSIIPKRWPRTEVNQTPQTMNPECRSRITHIETVRTRTTSTKP
jgi:hypothetical protein